MHFQLPDIFSLLRLLSASVASKPVLLISCRDTETSHERPYQNSCACRWVRSPDLEGTCARIITALDTNGDRAMSTAELNAAALHNQEYLLSLDFSDADTGPRAGGDGKLNVDECMVAVSEHFKRTATAEQKERLENNPTKGWRNWVQENGCNLHTETYKHEL